MAGLQQNIKNMESKVKCKVPINERKRKREENDAIARFLRP